MVEGREWEGRMCDGVDDGGGFQLALVTVAGMLDGTKGT